MATTTLKKTSRGKKGARPRAPERFAEAEELYGIDNWGKGFFSVDDDGHLLVHPTRERDRSIDLKAVVDEVAGRGMTVPLIVRFPQILASSVKELNEAFVKAIR